MQYFSLSLLMALTIHSARPRLICLSRVALTAFGSILAHGSSNNALSGRHSGLVVYLDVPVAVLAQRLAAQAHADAKSTPNGTANAVSARPLLATAWDAAAGTVDQAKLGESLGALLAERQVTACHRCLPPPSSCAQSAHPRQLEVSSRQWLTPSHARRWNQIQTLQLRAGVARIIFFCFAYVFCFGRVAQTKYGQADVVIRFDGSEALDECVVKVGQTLPPVRGALSFKIKM
jgi:hypothetical protein